MDRGLTDLTEEAFREPMTNIMYHLSRRLRELFPDLALVETDDHAFGLEGYAAAGLCMLTIRARPDPQLDTNWRGPKHGVTRRATNAWYDVRWQGNSFDILHIEYVSNHGGGMRAYIVAESEAVADQFIAVVCAWTTELRDEVLVFEAGHWHKDPALFHSIKGATLDNLILAGTLKEDIRDDLASFFRNQETYERYGVPWKRGILFVGPPGNGKTHAVTALVNALAQDCLYVKSFRSQVPDEYSIRNVFGHARTAAPCILVLEDLDSLVTAQNRSFFLNELDGFAGNDGILTLATTNHPERLDPAIVDRPSRFDRKYPFDLPGVAERGAYIAMWNDTLQPELRLTEPGMERIAGATEGFSFAYLKELFVSATMRWINVSEPGSMDDVMAEQVIVLRGQMASAIVLDDVGDEEGEGSMPPHIARMIMQHERYAGDASFWGYPIASAEVWDDEDEE